MTKVQINKNNEEKPVNNFDALAALNFSNPYKWDRDDFDKGNGIISMIDINEFNKYAITGYF